MSDYNLKRIEKIRKDFERKKNGNLIQYTFYLEKIVLKAEDTISEFKSKLKGCSNKIEGALQKGYQ